MEGGGRKRIVNMKLRKRKGQERRSLGLRDVWVIRREDVERKRGNGWWVLGVAEVGGWSDEMRKSGGKRNNKSHQELRGRNELMEMMRRTSCKKQRDEKEDAISSSQVNPDPHHIFYILSHSLFPSSSILLTTVLLLPKLGILSH